MTQKSTATSLISKLQIKPGQQGRILNRPRSLSLSTEIDAGYFTTRRSDLDWFMAFVKSKADIDALAPKLTAATRGDSVIWICYPKQSSGIVTDINRDKGWDAIYGLGLKGVRQIAIDETWSALRFRYR